MDTILTVALFVASAILAVLGFFAKAAYGTVMKDLNDLKDDSHHHVEEQGKLKGKIELLEQEHRLKYQLIQETTQQEIRTMASKIGELSDTVGELVRIQMAPAPERPTRARR